MERTLQKIVFISREYSGIAEAGGVKGVVRALCEQCATLGIAVTQIMPLYACADLTCLTDYTKNVQKEVSLTVGDKSYPVTYSAGFLCGVRVVFAESPVFAKRRSPYTYTRTDEAENPAHIRGTGFEDAQLVNVLFQKAALSFCAENAPDIMHCHDAPCALVPALARELSEYKTAFEKTAFMVTIHNAGPSYHHDFPNIGEAVFFTGISHETLAASVNGNRVEPYLVAARYGVLTTVSPWYAEELQSPHENDNTDGLSWCFKNSGIKITGIVNGIFIGAYDTKDCAVSLLPAPFDTAAGDFAGRDECRKRFLSLLKTENAGSGAQESQTRQFPEIDIFGSIDTSLLEGAASSKKPVFVAYHGRLVWQKGIWVLCDAIKKIFSLESQNIFFFVNGQGEKSLENELIHIAEQFPGRVVFCRGYDKQFARTCVTAADFSVLPSIFEPCGTEDFIAQLFGTIPVAHATGGLQKIVHGQTGFLYQHDNELSPLLVSLSSDFHDAHGKYLKIMQVAAENVKKHYSWEHIVGAHYLPVYNSMLTKHPQQTEATPR